MSSVISRSRVSRRRRHSVRLIQFARRALGIRRAISRTLPLLWGSFFPSWLNSFAELVGSFDPKAAIRDLRPRATRQLPSFERSGWSPTCRRRDRAARRRTARFETQIESKAACGGRVTPVAAEMTRRTAAIGTAVCVLLVCCLQDVGAQSLASEFAADESVPHPRSDSFFTEPNTFAGFTTRLNGRAFDLLADYLKQRVNKFMKFGTVAFNLTLPLTPQVRFSLLSNGVTLFDGATFGSQMKVLPGREIVWTVSSELLPSGDQSSIQGSNLRLTVSALYRLSSSAGEISGSVPIAFERTALELGLGTSVNSDGHLKTDLQRCRVLLSDLRVDFPPADVDLIRSYIPFVHRAIRDQIDNLLCPTFHAELVPVISNRLLNTPLSAALFDHYFVNYGLIGPILYQSDAVELLHRGNVFGILRQGRTRLNDFRLPFRSAPLNGMNGRLFQLSNYTISSLLFWMDQYRKFDYEISKQSVNDTNIAGYLRTECGAQDICAGTLFPGSSFRLRSLHRSSFSAGQEVPERPREHQDAHDDLPARAHRSGQGGDRGGQSDRCFRHASGEEPPLPQRLDGRRVGAAQSEVQGLPAHRCTRQQQPAINRKKQLAGELNIENFKLSDVVSLVEGIDASSIEFLITALNDLIINEDVAKKLKDGLKLPIIFDFEQTNSTVLFEKDRIVIGADFCFDENCKVAVASVAAAKAEQSEDMDVNYYDAAG
ncbi:putative lipid-binding protein OBI-1 [Aphelenchoides fujianensis]|nr:putative lipid-binding protein OBI-1 [Aphelenchoides fujianensis]